ncbi:MAG: flagellar assembly protein T N-terminal domain-containing protein [Gemmobacter sp.]|nr:flagellar assembly protein T N-terminal domain-containing protein [Gemmobacter sp.]
MAFRLPALIALLMLALLPAGLQAKPRWIEATGIAFPDGPADRESARRRAVADALLQAALAGGADLRGHSVQHMGRITSDLLILRPVGQVLEFRVLQETRHPDRIELRISALVGPEGTGGCAPRPLTVTVFTPQVHVATGAPAWAGPLADQVAERLRRQIGRTEGVTVDRIVATRAPLSGAAPRGHAGLNPDLVRLAPGDYGLAAEIRFLPVAAGLSGRGLRLELTLDLIGGGGAASRATLQADARLPGSSPLGRAAVLAQPGRDRLAQDLTRDLEPVLQQLVQRVRCKPLAARLQATPEGLAVDLGRRHGLGRGAIAFTTDGDSSTELLEIVRLDDSRALLRPLDPQSSAAALAGRSVRFLETGM